MVYLIVLEADGRLHPRWLSGRSFEAARREGLRWIRCRPDAVQALLFEGSRLRAVLDQTSEKARDDHPVSERDLYKASRAGSRLSTTQSRAPVVTVRRAERISSGGGGLGSARHLAPGRRKWVMPSLCRL